MPAEKRPADTQNDEVSPLSLSKLRRYDDDVVDDVVVVQHQQPQDQQQQQQPDDFSSNNNTPTLEQNQLKLEGEEQQDNGVLEEDLDDYDDTQLPQQEFVDVDLQTIRKEVQCPICLGIIKKTRTVMECLHRFCRECIDKSMRMGNNECPACRTHCASRRSLRDDPRYDALIAALYPDIKKFEEEELAFCEEDESRNKQIQESISQVLKKQSEVTKKRPAIKETASPSTTRNSRNAQSRRRRRRRRRNASADQDSDDDAHNSYMNFDPDEHQTEIKQMKGKSRASTGSSHSSPSATPLIGKSLENNLDQSKESRGFSPGLTCSTEMLAWGRGGIRSNTRNSNANGGVSRNARRMCLAKLVDFLRNLEENDEEYITLQTSPDAGNVQVTDMQDLNNHQSTPHPSSSRQVGPSQDQLYLQDREHTLSGAVASCIPNGEQLILAKDAM